MAMGKPRRAANGQLNKADRAVAKMAKGYDFLNQAPWDTMVKYMDVVDGRNAVEDMKNPAEKTIKARVIRPTLGPISLTTPLKK